SKVAFLTESLEKHLSKSGLTVDVDEESGDFYVHWINVKAEEPRPQDVCGPFPTWARRIAE
ncbi:Na+/H+ antiporter subunit E, partial [Candidatus Bipolaricaulota bacterium]|nr:Na+/H+ antiporter subunit E [Candidatus Bipolaricaulota bacterium]